MIGNAVGLPTQLEINKGSVAGRVDCRPLEFSNFSTSESFLGGDPLAQEILGFFFFGVPLLQLFGTKEADDALTNRVAI